MRTGTKIALVAALVGVGLAGVLTTHTDERLRRLIFPDKVHRILIHYTAWDGRRRPALVVVPAWYKRGMTRALPLVISPHGREQPISYTADRWGNLPARDGFFVVCPAGEGRVLPSLPFSAPGEIEDLARMPDIVQHALPWLHIDRQCIYAIGDSMGGQEVLSLAARFPDRLAGVVAMDPVADLATRYWQMRYSQRSGTESQRDLITEVGGTPLQVPFDYAQRSPMTFVDNLAFDGLPLQLWWSRVDRIVIDQATTQTGLLYRRVRALNPRAPVRQVITDLPHSAAFGSRYGLPRAIAFLRPHGVWRQVRETPPRGWCYKSWEPYVDIWDYRFSTNPLPDHFWTVRDITPHRLTVTTSAPFVAAVPTTTTRSVLTVHLGRRVRHFRVVNGYLRLLFPPGTTTAYWR